MIRLTPTTATPAGVASRLSALCAGPGHEFWSDSVSLLDESLFRPQAVSSHRQITDAYLLGLAVRRGGRLATFDRSISLKAVVGAAPAHLELIPPAPTSP
jgi:hypothetical protein